MKITFIAKGIEEVKTKISNKIDIELQAERFREDMLSKHDLLFTKASHLIGITYN